MRESLSNNHHSFDIQVRDVVTWFLTHDTTHLSRNEQHLQASLVDKFETDFPEWDNLVWSGSWVDIERSDVDWEYMHWVADWLEVWTDAYWEDGEPWVGVYDPPENLPIEPGEW